MKHGLLQAGSFEPCLATKQERMALETPRVPSPSNSNKSTNLNHSENSTTAFFCLVPCSNTHVAEEASCMLARVLRWA